MPWETLRREAVVSQVAAAASLVFILVPMLTTHLRGGVGPRGNPYGWFSCADYSPLGEEMAKYLALTLFVSARNGARFAIARRACCRFSKAVASFRREGGENDALLPWPSLELRAGATILGRDLGWKLPFVVTLSMGFLFNVVIALEGVAILAPCSNNPPEASLLSILTSGWVVPGVEK